MRVIWNTCGAQCVGCSLISGLPVQGSAMFSRKKTNNRKTPNRVLDISPVPAPLTTNIIYNKYIKLPAAFVMNVN